MVFRERDDFIHLLDLVWLDVDRGECFVGLLNVPQIDLSHVRREQVFLVVRLADAVHAGGVQRWERPPAFY